MNFKYYLMRDFAKTLLSIGLTIGLSDRESFVKSVSELIKEYQDDPQKEKWARSAVDYLEQLRDNINLQNSIKGAVADAGFADQKEINELTRAIEELTGELRKRKNNI